MKNNKYHVGTIPKSKSKIVETSTKSMIPVSHKDMTSHCPVLVQWLYTSFMCPDIPSYWNDAINK